MGTNELLILFLGFGLGASCGLFAAAVMVAVGYAIYRSRYLKAIGVENQ